MRPEQYRIGIDENGLGARLGPLLVTAVLARVDERGERFLGRALPAALALDLGDSKQLVAHGNTALGEAWARALTPAATPAALLEMMAIESSTALQTICPKSTRAQCWSAEAETFTAPDELVARVRKHVATFAARGVELLRVRTSPLCTKRLNLERDAGKNRFVADLHAMERLVTDLHAFVDEAPIRAVCGKVGGMADYDRFFGPLSGRLHTTLEQSAARSSYHFAGLGELSFVRDADASDPLVMLASLVGKYLRELLMTRIATWYQAPAPLPSGYHDPITDQFVVATQLLRRRRRVSQTCFERDRDVCVTPRVRA